MPERDQVVVEQKNSSVKTFFEHSGFRVYSVIKQPQLSFCRHNRHKLDNLACLSRQAANTRQHRIAYIDRYTWSIVGESFCDEERIAACESVKILDVFAFALRKLTGCDFGKWRQTDPRN